MNLAKQLEELQEKFPGSGEFNLERGLAHIGYNPKNRELILGENYEMPFTTMSISPSIEDLNDNKATVIILKEFLERSSLENTFLLSVFGNRDFLEQLRKLKTKLIPCMYEKDNLNFMLFEGYKLGKITTLGYIIKPLMGDRIPFGDIQRGLLDFEQNQNGVYVHNGKLIGNSYNFNHNE